MDGHLERIDAQYLLDMNLGFKQDLAGLELDHTLTLKNVTDSEMLTAEYIRQTTNINSLATMAFGRRLVYSARIEF